MAQTLTDLDLGAFLDKLASDEPAPGGGSASALAAALAAGLVEMVARLTQGRAEFTAVEKDMRALLDASPGLRDELTRLVDRDTQAFRKVMAAMRLPRGTPEEKAARKDAVERATREASEVPLRVTELACEVLGLARAAAEKGNPNAVTDAGVAGRLALAGAEGAALNVKINLPGIKDETFRAGALRQIEQNLALARKMAAEVAETVERRMSQ